MRTLVAGYRMENVRPVVDILMADSGFELTIVRTLDKAVERVEQGPPYDLVILFLCLPDAPGLEAFELLFPKIPDTPIVMISPNHDDRTAFLALAEGAQDFLVEGEFNDTSLVRSMVFACARHAYRQVHREIETVKGQVTEMAAKLDEVQSAYLDLLETVTALNKTLAATGVSDDAATRPR